MPAARARTYAQSVREGKKLVREGETAQWDFAKLTWEVMTANGADVRTSGQPPRNGGVSKRQWAADLTTAQYPVSATYVGAVCRLWQRFGAGHDHVQFAEAYQRTQRGDAAVDAAPPGESAGTRVHHDVGARRTVERNRVAATLTPAQQESTVRQIARAHPEVVAAVVARSPRVRAAVIVAREAAQPPLDDSTLPNPRGPAQARATAARQRNATGGAVGGAFLANVALVLERARMQVQAARELVTDRELSEEYRAAIRESVGRVDEELNAVKSVLGDLDMQQVLRVVRNGGRS